MTDRELKKLSEVPPFLENISRDIVINKKLKILLEKSNHPLT